jgi:uroporphyrinogen-III synthase
MKVLITRGKDRAESTAQVFAAHGLQTAILPMVCYEKLPEPKFLRNSYDLCVFTSPASVGFFADFVNIGQLKVSKYAAVGSATAAEIKQHMGISEVITPAKAYQTELLKLLSDSKLAGCTVLAPGPVERTGDMKPFFASAGAIYEQVDTYQTVPVIYPEGEVMEFIQQNGVDTLSFFSPSAVHAYMRQASCENLRVAAIGSTTAMSLDKYGVSAIMPERQTAEAMAEMLGGAKIP